MLVFGAVVITGGCVVLVGKCVLVEGGVAGVCRGVWGAVFGAVVSSVSLSKVSLSICCSMSSCNVMPSRLSSENSMSSSEKSIRSESMVVYD